MFKNWFRRVCLVDVRLSLDTIEGYASAKLLKAKDDLARLYEAKPLDAPALLEATVRLSHAQGALMVVTTLRTSLFGGKSEANE